MKTRIFCCIVLSLALTGNIHADSFMANDNYNVQPGQEFTIDLNLQTDNMGKYVGWQFDLSLPKGFEVTADGCSLVNDRYTDAQQVVTWKKTGGYDYRFTCYSADNKPMTGQKGVIARLHVKADASVSEGEFSGELKHVFFTTLDTQGNTATVNMDNSSIVFYVWKPVTVTAKSYTRQYGADNPGLEYTVTGGGSLGGTPQLTCEASVSSPVGSYDILVGMGSVQNPFVTFVKGTLTIEKAPLTISAGNYVKKQGDAMPVFKATYSGFKLGQTEAVLTRQPVFSCTADEASAPGTYPVKVSGAEATNYAISYVDGTLTVTAADQITVTARSCTRQYGEANPALEYEVSGGTLQGAPELVCEATPSSPVGTYDIVVRQGSVSSYNVVYVKGTLTVEKAPLTISAGNYVKKQGEAMPVFKASYSGFKLGETEAVLTKQPVFSCTADEASAPGTYPVKVSGAEATNYAISYVDGTLTVTAADQITVTARSCTRQYGEANPAFEYEVSGGTLQGTPELVCEAVPSSPVGTYDIVVRQGSVSSYNVVYVKGTLTVEKAPLTISAGNYVKKQGDAMPVFKATYSGFKLGETEAVLTRQPVFSCTADEASAPGTYPVKVSGAEAKNYAISYVDGTLTVTAADQITVTARSYTRQYGEANPALEYEVSGGTLQGAPELVCEATLSSPVGTYDIVVRQGSVSSYNVVYVKGTLTVEKAPLTITANSYTINQYEPMPTFAAQYDGFKLSDDASVFIRQPQFSCAALDSSEPGEYPIRVYGYEALNYDITPIDGLLTIVAVEEGIHAADASEIIIRQLSGRTVDISGLHGGDTVSICDIAGRHLLTAKARGDSLELNLAPCPMGVYLVNVNNQRVFKIYMR